MSKISAIKLVRSLSGSEKRYFKLYAKRQSVDRVYVDLFKVIDQQGNDTSNIETAFSKLHKLTSIHNAAKYLIKVLTDCLIQLKMNRDIQFQLYQGIMRTKILQERSLQEDAHKELLSIRSNAIAFQHPMITYLTYREELNYLSDINFPALTDKTLVGMQMQAKEVLRDLSSVHDHHSLFELLKYRLIYAHRISSKDQLEKLNDLVLSEMGLAISKPSKSFSAKKLHLLFQSFYFTNIGEYKSALKTFAALNKLFESNLTLLDNPPLDYFSVLNGILDNLHVLGYYEQMSFYISKVEQLDQAVYPAYFRNQVQKTVVIFRSILLMSTGEYESIIDLVNQKGKDWRSMYSLVDEAKQWELYLCLALSYYHLGNLNKAHRWINQLLQTYTAQKNWLVCKAVRLLNIAIYYEQGDSEYLEYEIKSYRRFFEKEHLLKSELLFFRYIRLKPEVKYLKKQPTKDIIAEIQQIESDRFEKQLLRYFDCIRWIKDKMADEKFGRERYTK